MKCFRHGYYVCHRLDYSTSGILVIPLTKKSARESSASFENSKVVKHYLAILRGHCLKNFYKINLAIGEDLRPEVRKLKVATSDSEFCDKPRESETLMAVLSKGLYCGEPATKVLLKPLTGRRHQLRVHCRYLGHTIGTLKESWLLM